MTTPGESVPPSTPPAEKKPMPVVQASLGRRLSAAVVTALGISLAAAACLIAVAGVKIDTVSWWAAYRAGSVVAVIAVLGSLAVIRQAVGKPVSMLPATTMLLSGVRLGISLAGLIVAVKAYQMPPEPTAVMICGYYAVVLVVESFVMHRALRPISPPGL